MYVNIVIERYLQDENQSLGVCSIITGSTPIFSAISLERGWRNNESNVSCIPPGIYDVVLEYSPKFDTELWEIKGVENRSECKFHSANYWYELNGCISLGNAVGDINGDNYTDILNSRDTMQIFHTALKGCTNVKLIIK